MSMLTHLQMIERRAGHRIQVLQRRRNILREAMTRLRTGASERVIASMLAEQLPDLHMGDDDDEDVVAATRVVVVQQPYGAC